jgi:transposase
MEATGGLEVRVAAELSRHDLPVAVVDPRQALSDKTDRVDAIILASAFVICLIAYFRFFHVSS